MGLSGATKTFWNRRRCEKLLKASRPQCTAACEVGVEEKERSQRFVYYKLFSQRCYVSVCAFCKTRALVIKIQGESVAYISLSAQTDNLLALHFAVVFTLIRSLVKLLISFKVAAAHGLL